MKTLIPTHPVKHQPTIVIVSDSSGTYLKVLDANGTTQRVEFFETADAALKAKALALAVLTAIMTDNSPH